MTVEDIPKIVVVERDAFPTENPGTNFRRELANRLAAYLVAYRTCPDSEAGEAREELVGYAGMWFVLDEAHLTAIGVSSAHRRRGVGRRLLATALERALEREATMMTLEVRVSNHGAQALYERFGFRRVGVRRSYYSDNHEDAYLMTVEPIDSPGYREKLEQLKVRAAPDGDAI